MSSIDEISFRKPQPSDLQAYTDLFQRTYQDAYASDEIGLKAEYLSPEIFNNDDTQNYLRSKLLETDCRRVWLAYIKDQLIGSITIEDKGDECEVSAFYVDPAYQGRGIGKLLWNKAMAFAAVKDVILDLYAHNTKTLDMYKKWGFEIDESKGEKGVFYRHWPEWPEHLQAKAYYMRQKAVNRNRPELQSTMKASTDVGHIF